MSDKYRVEIVMSVYRERSYTYETLASHNISLTATDDQLCSMYLADALQKMYTQAVTAGILAAREQEQDGGPEQAGED